MKLQEIFDQLSSGEFSQLSIGGAPAGVIDDSNYGKVIGHINLGLTALHSRFNLKEGELKLAMQPGQTVYRLHSSYATNGPGAILTRYILDTEEEPFKDDIIKVEKVFDAEGAELPLNDAAWEDTLTTPTSRVLKVPDTLATQELRLVYRANHPKIIASYDLEPEEEEVVLPDTHLTPLLYYVASRVHNPIGMSNEFHAGNSYAAKYEQACMELESKGLQIDLTQTNTKFSSRGFV